MQNTSQQVAVPICFEMLDKTLVIESQEENLKCVGPNFSGEELTDYATSRSNLVIMTNDIDKKKLTTCFIMIAPNVSGLVAEVKEADDTEHPV